jgi:hypothetical protein
LLSSTVTDGQGAVNAGLICINDADLNARRLLSMVAKMRASLSIQPLANHHDSSQSARGFNRDDSAKPAALVGR